MGCITNLFSSIFCFWRKNTNEEVNFAKLKYLSDMTKLDGQNEIETKKSEKKKKKKQKNESEESEKVKKKSKKIKKSAKVEAKEIKNKTSKKTSKKAEKEKPEKKVKEKENKKMAKKREEMKNKTIPQTDDSFFKDESDFNFQPLQEKKLYLDQEIQLKEKNRQYQSEFTDYSYIIDKYIVNTQERPENRNNLAAKEVSVLLKNKMEQYIKNTKDSQN